MFGTDLVFSSDERAALERRAATFMFERRISDTVTVGGGAGVGLPGYLELGEARERYSIGPGWLLAGSMSWRLVDERASVPFVLLSAALGASWASTEHIYKIAPATPLIALDIRAGVLVGKTLWDALTPYAAARLFGGPVFWERRGESVVGTDLRHFQLAVGVSSSLPGGVDLFAEVAPLGERAVTVGAGLAL